MTGEEPAGEARACSECGQPVPADRSVCPACGTLQRGRVQDPITAELALGGPPVSGVPPSGFAGAGRPPGPPPVPAPGPDTPRSWRGGLVLIIGAIVCVVGVVGGGFFLDRRDDDKTASTTTPTEATPTTSPSAEDPAPVSAKGARAQAAAVRGYCNDPRPLTQPSGIASFTPGEGAVAFVELPRAPSSTEPAGELTVQVSPEVGTPGLSLEKSISFVSLAVCLDETGSRSTKGTCDYELTNSDSLGERATAHLDETAYTIELRELTTAKVLVKGSITTATDHCPQEAFVRKGQGVSNSLTDAQILTWIAVNLVDGKPN